jgi:predicted dehydrogenase
MTTGKRTPLRLGLAGLSHDHISIAEHISPDDFEIVGAYDADPALLSAVAPTLGVPKDRRYTDLTAMVAATRPDAVAALGSIFDHLAVVEACAPAGVNVMVEKPLAVSVDHALRIFGLSERHGIHVLTNYETTWYASNAQVFREVRDGLIGMPRKVLVRAGHAGPIESGCQPQFLAWLTNPALSGGGALSDFGCYGANLATFLMEGRTPNSVTAMTRTFKPELYREIEDDALVVLAYDGVEVVIQASWNWPYQRKDMEIHGIGGSLIAADSETVWFQRAGESRAELLSPAPLPRRLGEPFAYFAAVLRGEEAPAPHALSALANNLAVVRILDAARRSAKAGRTVPLTGASA